MTQHDLAAAFRHMHARGADPILVLPNAWDAMSARVVEAAGGRAIATTSAGISWALGSPDGQGVSRELMVESVRRIVVAVRVPVTADVESGYGSGTPDDVAATVRAILAAGAVGINLEDSPGRDGAPMLDIALQSARLAAARAAAAAHGVDLFINARIDTYLRQVGTDAEARFDETVRRARAYVAAGADGAFVPMVADAPTIERLARAIDAPLNILGTPAAPDVRALQALGVARVSVGPGLARAVMTFIQRSATESLESGTHELLRGALTSPEANALFAARPASI